MKNIRVKLELDYFKENDFIVVYAPALELSAYGSTLSDANKSFNETLEIFFEELMDSNKLLETLLELGWVLQKKPIAKYTPPEPKLKTRPSKQLCTSKQLIKKSEKFVNIPI